MEIQLDGKIALVTGGSSGIGKAIAQALKECGAKVVVNYLGPQGHDPVIEKLILESGAGEIAIQADISDQKQVSDMFAKIDKELGEIDILVNCAGVDGNAALNWNIEAQQWGSNMDVNLTGAFYCAQHALARMKGRKSGVILNITSVDDTLAWTGEGAYRSSKAALSMLTKTMALEVAPLGIRVLALAPGAMKLGANVPVPDDVTQLSDLLEQPPTGRRRRSGSREIGRFAAVLVSDFACYVTGTTIVADGRMSDYSQLAQRAPRSLAAQFPSSYGVEAREA